MQTAVNTSLLVTDSSSSKKFADQEELFSFGGLYHHFAAGLVRAIHTKEMANRLAAELVSIAERAYPWRQLDILRSAGEALMNLPLERRYRNVGLFYEALSVSGGGKGDAAKARSLFERVADDAPGRYRAKALLALGSGSVRSADHKTGLLFFQEAMNLMTRDRTPDAVTALRAGQNASIVRSAEGDHQGALTVLQALYPLARTAGLSDALAYPDYMSNLAVELCEAGRLEEARRASQIAVASPFAPVFPEWTETFAEIEVKMRRASRSIVTVPLVPQAPPDRSDSLARIVSWPGDHSRQVDAAPLGAKHSASIISLHDWKKKLEDKSKDDTRQKPTLEEIRSMDFTEKQATITRCVYADEVDEEMLISMLQVALATDDGDTA